MLGPLMKLPTSRTLLLLLPHPYGFVKAFPLVTGFVNGMTDVVPGSFRSGFCLSFVFTISFTAVPHFRTLPNCLVCENVSPGKTILIWCRSNKTISAKIHKNRLFRLLNQCESVCKIRTFYCNIFLTSVS